VAGRRRIHHVGRGEARGVRPAFLASRPAIRNQRRNLVN
jgi:hypothetical protein